MIALYLHFPFCLKKCHYCSFNSFPLPQSDQGRITARGYLDALEKEILLYASQNKDLALSSIYCGGGTPTILPAEDLRRVLDLCRRSFCLSDQIEITVEANPGTVSQKLLCTLKEAGVNRLSLGAQSFHLDELGLLGRVHDASEIYAAYADARSAGFTNINLDLIYALPGQSLASWSDNLRCALELRPEHLSIYGLSLEEGTPLARDIAAGKLKPCSEDDQVAMWEETARVMSAAGYVRYEISNYTRLGFECKHNITYWENTPYLGLGAGAQGYFEKVRYANESALEKYIEKVKSGELPRAFEEHQTLREERIDTIIMGLRLTKGLSRKGFEQRFGSPFEHFYVKELSTLVQDGLLEMTPDAIFLTDHGRILSNYVLSHFVG